MSAVSADGLVWEREPGLRLAGASVSYLAPRCLHLDPAAEQGSSRFRLYASAYPYPDVAGHKKIVSAVSEDGLVFELEPGVRIPQDRALESYAVYAPEVLRLGRGRLPHVLRRLDSGSRGPPWIKVSRQNLQRIFRGRTAVGQGPRNLH